MTNVDTSKSVDPTIEPNNIRWDFKFPNGQSVTHTIQAIDGPGDSVTFQRFAGETDIGTGGLSAGGNLTWSGASNGEDPSQNSVHLNSVGVRASMDGWEVGDSSVGVNLSRRTVGSLDNGTRPEGTTSLGVNLTSEQQLRLGLNTDFTNLNADGTPVSSGGVGVSFNPTELANASVNLSYARSATDSSTGAVAVDPVSGSPITRFGASVGISPLSGNLPNVSVEVTSTDGFMGDFTYTTVGVGTGGLLAPVAPVAPNLKFVGAPVQSFVTSSGVDTTGGGYADVGLKLSIPRITLGLRGVEAIDDPNRYSREAASLSVAREMVDYYSRGGMLSATKNSMEVAAQYQLRFPPLSLDEATRESYFVEINSSRFNSLTDGRLDELIQATHLTPSSLGDLDLYDREKKVSMILTGVFDAVGATISNKHVISGMGYSYDVYSNGAVGSEEQLFTLNYAEHLLSRPENTYSNFQGVPITSADELLKAVVKGEVTEGEGIVKLKNLAELAFPNGSLPENPYMLRDDLIAIVAEYQRDPGILSEYGLKALHKSPGRLMQRITSGEITEENGQIIVPIYLNLSETPDIRDGRSGASLVTSQVEIAKVVFSEQQLLDTLFAQEYMLLDGVNTGNVEEWKASQGATILGTKSEIDQEGNVVATHQVTLSEVMTLLAQNESSIPYLRDSVKLAQLARQEALAGVLSNESLQALQYASVASPLVASRMSVLSNESLQALQYEISVKASTLDTKGLRDFITRELPGEFKTNDQESE